MPPAVKRDCGLILFDMCSSQKETLLSGLINFATFKMLSDSKDSYRLVLVNSKQTKNEKNYPNLFVPHIDFRPQEIKRCIETAEPEEGDWLDGFLLAIHHLVEATGAVITLQLIYFTTLESKRIVDITKLQKVIDKLNETDIFVYIIGPDVKIPCTVTHPEAVMGCMEKLIVDETNPSMVAAETIIQNTNHSVLADLKVGINLLHCYKKPRGAQPWKVPMSFGSILHVPAITVRLYNKDQPLKLISTKPNRLKRVLVDDETVEVDLENIVKGITRHGKFVKIEEDMFKFDSPRCLEILGFISENSVPETHMRGEDVAYVFPDKDASEDSCIFFFHLVNELALKKKYAIAKRVYYANCKAKYNVLIPRPEMDPKRFLMVGLPYADELWKHQIHIPVPLKNQDEAKMTEIDLDMRNFLKSIDISNEPRKVDVPLSPMMMLEINAARLAAAGASKLLNEEIESMGLEDFDEEEPNEFAEKLKESWPQKTSDDD